MDRLLGRERGFRSPGYLRHNQRRLEHLATLGLDLWDRSVLELGAGVGDHTGFFVDRGCRVTATDARPENLKRLRERHPGVKAVQVDLNHPPPELEGSFEIVYAYGVLYHLHQPETALGFMARHAGDLLLLETCVSPGDDEAVNLLAEPEENPTQSVSGVGCRPTRPWIMARLREHFEHAYVPRTQPSHEEFPTDWKGSFPEGVLTRAVFVGSRRPLSDRVFSDRLLDRQPRRLPPA